MGVALTSRGIVWESTTADLTTSTNNWTPAGLSGAVVVYVAMSSHIDVTVAGLTGGEDGRLLFVVNYSPTNLLNLAHQSGSSTAANRFILDVGAGSLSLFPGDSVALLYDGTAQRWKQVMRHA